MNDHAPKPCQTKSKKESEPSERDRLEIKIYGRVRGVRNVAPRRLTASRACGVCEIVRTRAASEHPKGWSADNTSRRSNTLCATPAAQATPLAASPRNLVVQAVPRLRHLASRLTHLASRISHLAARSSQLAALPSQLPTLRVPIEAHANEPLRTPPLAHRAGRRPALGQPGARSAEREHAGRTPPPTARGT